MEGSERVGVVTMTKKFVSFFRKNRMTPSVTAPGDTNLSDATGLIMGGLKQAAKVIQQTSPIINNFAVHYPILIIIIIIIIAL